MSITAKRLGLPSRMGYWGRKMRTDPDIPLTDGRWVHRRHGVWHWVPDEAAS
ncbi:hypothetical protein PZ894_07400 [Nocardioides sp. YIM 152315]|nr:hypothetical protein [Nocardioides sp. YIM 152315]